MLTSNDISIASTSNENVCRCRYIFYRLHSMSVHTLKYCYRVDMGWQVSYHAWRAQIGSISVTETTEPIPKNILDFDLVRPYDTF